jgi:hypothetical protein
LYLNNIVLVKYYLQFEDGKKPMRIIARYASNPGTTIAFICREAVKLNAWLCVSASQATASSIIVMVGVVECLYLFVMNKSKIIEWLNSRIIFKDMQH